MNIIILGAAGFIGTNLALELSKDEDKHIILVDRNEEKLRMLADMCKGKIDVHKSDIVIEPDLDEILAGQDIVFHLVSTTVPTTSNQEITKEIENNVEVMSKLLESCVRCQVGRIVFLSSGGTVYGVKNNCPLKEEMETFPMNSYGVQKVMNEKLLYLYHYIYGLDYKIIRLANPYGPYQNPDGIQGAATTFTYKALQGEEIAVYGDGSIIRDYIYIEDAVRAIINIACSGGEEKVFNVGSGQGISISQLLKTIEYTLGIKLKVNYMPGRTVDVPVNFLDISKYEKFFGKLITVTLEEGIRRTADFMRKEQTMG